MRPSDHCTVYSEGTLGTSAVGRPRMLLATTVPSSSTPPSVFRLTTRPLRGGSNSFEDMATRHGAEASLLWKAGSPPGWARFLGSSTAEHFRQISRPAVEDG